jgi:hypothetical protein
MARNAILKADPAASAPLSKLQIQFFLNGKKISPRSRKERKGNPQF